MNTYVLVILLLLPSFLLAQKSEVAIINRIEKSYKIKNQQLVRYEKVDTLNYGDGKMNGYRYYYISKKARELSSIAVRENGGHHKKGWQIIYSFSDDRLIKITYTPAPNKCRRCKAEYYFQDDQLLYRLGNAAPDVHLNQLIHDAQVLQSHAPRKKECGHFEGEKCKHKQ
jgi:hypothetical protein